MSESIIPRSPSKEARAHHVVDLEFSSQDGFNRTISWLNNNVGKGRDFWEMTGKPGRALRDGRRSIGRLHIYVSGVSDADIMILGLST